MVRVPLAETLANMARAGFAWIPFEQVLIVGGLARALAAKRFGISRLPWSSGRDIDLVVFSATDDEWSAWIASLPQPVRQTIFGGVRLRTAQGFFLDVYRYPDQDIHRIESLGEFTYYPVRVPPFSSDRFAVTRDLDLVCSPEARLNLIVGHLELYREPVAAETRWARRRILQAMASGWSVSERAREFYEKKAPEIPE
jgi:hypothetical protein